MCSLTQDGFALFSRGNAPDFCTLRKPEVAIGSSGNTEWVTLRPGQPKQRDHPIGVMRPILLVSPAVNQRLPSGPAVMPPGRLLDVGIGNLVICPDGAIRPMSRHHPHR